MLNRRCHLNDYQVLKNHFSLPKTYFSRPQALFRSGNNLVPIQSLGYNVAQRRNIMLATHNSVVRARIDGNIKIEAEAVLASIGLTASDAFRMLMMRIAKEKKLPFAPLVPNEETIEAMKAARRGELVAVGSADNLLEMLNAGD
jgi:DNA-damage-inducible protein J